MCAIFSHQLSALSNRTLNAFHRHRPMGVYRKSSGRIRSSLAGLLCLVGFSTVIPFALAQEDDSQASKAENSENREEAIRRIGAMSASVTSNGATEPLKIGKDPILVFSDPTRKENDGTVWAIGTEGRPKAIISLFTSTEAKSWSYEFVSLSSEFSVRNGEKWTWKPKSSGLSVHKLKVDASSANTPAARLSQMKMITRDFSAKQVLINGTRNELRLLSRPLLRYSDEKLGIVDGAIFAFANGTNPEILLLVEMVKENGGQNAWQYGAARMAAAELHLLQNDVEVWTAGRPNGNTPDVPYFWRAEPRRTPGSQ